MPACHITKAGFPSIAAAARDVLVGRAGRIVTGENRFRPLRPAHAHSSIRRMSSTEAAFYRAVTRDVDVCVTPRFLEERSSRDPDRLRSEHRALLNQGTESLLNRRAPG